MPDKVCKAFKKCGGCQLAMSYDEQLRYKNQKAKQLGIPILSEDDFIARFGTPGISG